MLENCKIGIILTNILLFTGIVSSASVGTVPGSVDFGEVRPGETVETEINIRANNIRDTFKIKPTTSSDSKNDLFSDNFPGRFDVSEQSFEDWVSLEETSINPTSEQTITLSNGNKAVVNGDFGFTMAVPDNAEPGIRRGVVRLNPDISSGSTGGAGARVIGTTKLNYQFEVPGEARRQISVQDVRAFRRGQTQAAIEILLRNSGTVTATTRNFEIAILDSTGASVGNVRLSGSELSPGESRWVEGFWSEESQIPQGTYQIDGGVNYMTGRATASGSFTLPGFNVVEIRPDDDTGTSNQSSNNSNDMPIWFVIIILAILGVLMWGFNIEPFWIISILGVLGISAFIITSGLPNILLVILLIMVAIIIYGGM